MRIPQLKDLMMIICLEKSVSLVNYLISVTIVVDVIENGQNRLSVRNSLINKSF